MRGPTDRAPPRALLLALGLALGLGPGLAACDQWALEINGGTGLVFIGVSGDGTRPGEGYRVRARQAGVADTVVTVATDGELRLPPRAGAAGPLELTLLAPAGCAVTSPNPQTIDPAQPAAAHVRFTLRCAAA